MDYDIKNFEEKFLIDQVKLVNDYQKDWEPKPFLQTVKNYKQIFKSDNYKEDLNLYYFENNELKGLVNSSLRGTLTTIDPFVKNNDSIILGKLFDRLKSNIKENYQAVESLRMIGGIEWSNKNEVIEKLGFTKGEVRFLSTTVGLDQIPKSDPENNPNVNIVDYDEKLHFDGLVNLFKANFNFPEELLLNEIKEMYKLKPLIISWKVAISNQQVIGHGLLLLDKPNHDYCYLREIISKDNDAILFHTIYNSMIEDLIQDKREINSITIRAGKNSHQISMYKELGYSFNEYSEYMLAL